MILDFVSGEKPLEACEEAALTYSKPGLAMLGCYAKVELVPPSPAEISTAIQSLKDTVHSAKTGSFRQCS